LGNAEPEKLILKIPKKLWILKSRGLAFCMPRRLAVVFFIVSIIFIPFIILNHYYFQVSILQWVVDVTAWGIVVSLSTLLFLPTIFIRKDCFECQFSFHIIAHERNHLLLNSSDEITIEEETLKQTRGQLISLFLSEPKMCRDCLLKGRKLYCQATFDYLRIQKT